VQGVLGIAPAELIAATLEAIQSHDVVAVSQQLHALYNHGFEPAQIARQLGHEIREGIVQGNAVLPHELSIPLLEKLLQVPASPDPKIALQIALLDVALAGTSSSTAPKPAAPKPVAKPAAPNQKVMPAQEVKAAPAVEVTPSRPVAKKEDEKPQPEALAVAEASASQPQPAPGDALTEKQWQDVLAAIKSKYNTLYSVARTARAHFEPGILTLEFSHAFHQKRLNESRNKELICEMVLKHTGVEVQLSCIKGTGKTEDELRPIAAPPLPDVDGEVVHNIESKVEIPEVKPKEKTVEAISNIFGGAEVLEP
jgi:DNA polymerase III gamma/tau subunit